MSSETTPPTPPDTQPRSNPVDETLALAGVALGAALAEPRELGGSARSLVLRCRVVAGLSHDGVAASDRLDTTRASAHAPGTTVIVKRFGGAQAFVSEFAREAAGLAVLDRTPVLLAVDVEHRLVVMSDLGSGPTLADLLLAGTETGEEDAAPAVRAGVREAAREGARTWAAALGDLVGASTAHVARFDEALASFGGTVDWDLRTTVAAGVDRLVAAVDGVAREPGLAAGLAAELDEMATLGDRGHADVVSPSDTCPDNAVRTATGWAFLDLEGSSVHHAALDAAYAALPFATCWCVLDPPPGFTDDLLTAFTTALGHHRPDVVEEPGWSSAVDAACGAYVLACSGWLFDGALEGRPRVGPAGVPSPSYRQLLASRWRWGADRLGATLPHTATLLAEAAAWADRAWGDDARGQGGYPALDGDG
ncbi:hypothetical protein [Oerskovia flava]|uniref:hypothetical protein n=1 Tax=Oerskovia flava TaxID=2986422 RepID=UPI002240B638|nr:hypothetical protein [Oerskovia sp. JB1-3-2]